MQRELSAVVVVGVMLLATAWSGFGRSTIARALRFSAALLEEAPSKTADAELMLLAQVGSVMALVHEGVDVAQWFPSAAVAALRPWLALQPFLWGQRRNGTTDWYQALGMQERGQLDAALRALTAHQLPSLWPLLEREAVLCDIGGGDGFLLEQWLLQGSGADRRARLFDLAAEGGGRGSRLERVNVDIWQLPAGTLVGCTATILKGVLSDLPPRRVIDLLKLLCGAGATKVVAFDHFLTPGRKAAHAFQLSQNALMARLFGAQQYSEADLVSLALQAGLTVLPPGLVETETALSAATFRCPA